MSRQEEIENPAFGMIDIGRVSGRAELFMVDYPQQHFISIKIRNAKLIRDLSSNWVHAHGVPIVEVLMSEVQFARAIASLNTSGVPCTLAHYRSVESGEVIHRPAMPPAEKLSNQFSKEIRQKAARATEAISNARKKLDEIRAGGSIRKSDLDKVIDLLGNAERDTASNLPFVVERAEETIQESVEQGKAEISAYSDFVVAKLGERAFAEKVIELGSAAAAMRLIEQQDPTKKG